MTDFVDFDSPIVFGQGPCSIYQNLFMKVYHDGGHHVGSLLLPKRPSSHFREKKDSDKDRLYREFYRSSLQKSGDKKMRVDSARLRAKLEALDALEKAFPEEKEQIRQNSDDMHERMISSLAARKKRFRRKAFLNEWTHFVTVTYDSTLFASEDEFRAAVDKLFSNCHTRLGWRYMGVWESGELNERLHFHCLLYVPEDSMLGCLYHRSDYSWKTHGIKITHSNTYFERRFGRNDFEPLVRKELNQSIEYILKYIEKSGERIRYSRGIPTEIFIPVRSIDVVEEYTDFVQKYILFDDVIDWERDVKNARAADEEQARAKVNHKYEFDTLWFRAPDDKKISA